MALNFPPSVSINNLIGGYASQLNYTNLADNQTNNAANVEITLDGSLKSRPGYVRRNYSRIKNVSSSNDYEYGEPITGYFQLVKLGESFGDTVVKAEVVAAGNSLYKYTVASQTAIATGLQDGSQVYWQFAQIQDPRSASDDIIIMTNGYNPIKIWNGTDASASNLSAVNSATQVPLAKFINVLQNRVYLLNINDSSDIDAKCKVVMSTFDELTGAPMPQKFDQEFYVGGSDRYGEITGHAVLSDQLIIFKRNATYKFIPGNGDLVDTAGLIQMDEAIGCIAPNSIQTIENTIIFLTGHGVYAFDGSVFTKLSNPINKDFLNLKETLLPYAQSVYNKAKNQYWLICPNKTYSKNSIIFIYDLNRNIWLPPYTDINFSFLGKYLDGNDETVLIGGDYNGYLYEADKGTCDGLGLGYTGYFDDITGTSYTDNDADFFNSGDGLAGLKIRIPTGNPSDPYRTILSNTSKTIVLDTNFGAEPETSDAYSIGGINSYYRTKDFDFGASDIDKVYKKVTIRGTQQGYFNVNVNYIIDFNVFANVGSATILLYNDGLVWDYSYWDEAYWDGSEQLIESIPVRCYDLQDNVGKYLSLRFYNQNPNQPWEIYGFDIMMNLLGRRK